MSRPLTTITAFSAAFLVISLAGCNTDPLWTKTRDNQGPVTKLDYPEGVDIPDIQIADTQEVDLVEQVLYHRAVYKKSLGALRDYYARRGYNNKRQWAEFELADVERIKPFKYIMDAEIPASTLRPTSAIAEADEMYAHGLDLMKQGGHGVPVFYREDIMRQALATFIELINKYPNSDKIDDAAFCCGEIYKEYFKEQEAIAVKWYDRARTWDPRTPHPVRFQSAVIYDFRMHDRAKALELYHAVLKEENDNKSNTAFASRRIYELTEGMAQISQPRPPGAAQPASAPPPDMFGSEPHRPMRQSSAAPGEDKQLAAEELVPVIELGPDED